MYDIAKNPTVQHVIKMLEIKQPRNAERILDGINVLNKAVADKSIYNVHYNDLKYPFARILFPSIGSRWTKFLLDNREKWDDNGPKKDVYDFLYWEVLSMTDTMNWPISAMNKLKKTKLKDPILDEIAADIKQVLPIAQAMKDLKPHIIKGRVPSGKPPAPENPNKIVKTCPCCFRAIAVTKQGKMAHHGYRRPGDGWQTDSCPGIQFKPLEESDDGHKHMLKTFKDMISTIDHILSRPAQIMKVPGPRRRVGYQYQTVSLAKGEPEFDRYLSYYLENQKSMKRHLERDIETHTKFVAEFRKKYPI